MKKLTISYSRVLRQIKKRALNTDLITLFFAISKEIIKQVAHYIQNFYSL